MTSMGPPFVIEMSIRLAKFPLKVGNVCVTSCIEVDTYGN